MSWWDKEIKFKVSREKIDKDETVLKFKKVKPKLTEEQLTKKKKELKIKIPIYIFDYSLLIYFTMLLFFPEYIALASGFLTPFMGVVRVLYTIFLSFISFFLIFAVAAIGIMTYTTKLDSQKKEPVLPDIPSTKLGYVFSIVKSMYWIYLAFTLGFVYLSILLSMSFLFGLSYKYMEKDFTAKMTKLALIWEEPNKHWV